MSSSPRLRRTPAPLHRKPLTLLILLFVLGILYFNFSFAIPTAHAVSNSVVISQVFGGGGNSGAPLNQDFIEIFNRGTTSVSLGGLSVQYSSAGGNSGGSFLVEPLNSVTLAPGQYYLIAVSSAGSTGAALPVTADETSMAFNLSGTSGRVALVSSTTAISTSCSGGLPAGVIDYVGYGSASCFEGAGATPTLSNTTAAFRKEAGCTDTDNNNADFTTGTPAPRNTSSPTNSCGSGEPTPTPTATPTPIPTPTATPTIIPIHQIQGSGSTSPLVNQSVTTSGVVTATRTGGSGGFYIQTPDAEVDADPNTSQGLFVFTGNNLPAGAIIGNRVNVTGSVVEFRPNADLNSAPLTELSFVTSVTVLATGQTLPTPATINAAETTQPSETQNPLDTLEEYEGMRINISSLTVVSPTDGNVNEPNATATSTGVFYAVVTGVARPFREPGIALSDTPPAGTPAGAPRFDENPERLRVDSDAQPGATTINVTTGVTVAGVTGVLDYAFRTYTILPDAATPPTVTGNISAIPVPVAAANELTIGSFNIERFFDTTNDPNTGEPVLTTTAFNSRLNKASLAIRNVLRTPDVLGIIEAENLSTLQTLANKINSDTAAAGEPNPQYQAYLEEGNDVGGIDVGFLVKSTRVVGISVTQVGKDTTFTQPDGMQATLNDRPPLVLEASTPSPAGGSFTFTVVVNHLRSLTGVEENTPDGARVREKRRQQAEFLANYVQSRQTANPSEPIALVGDFNAFQFNDGLVDVIGTIKGTPTPCDQVLLCSPDLVNPDLINLVETLPANERYSFLFDGNAQVLDHVIVNDDFQTRFTRFAFARVDADFPEIFRNDPNRPERISDHDAPIAYFNLGTAPAPSPTVVPAGVAIANESCPPSNNQIDPGENVTVTLSLSNTGNSGTSDLVATLQPSANVISPSSPQSYGVLAPGATAARSFNFTADGVPGQTITLTLRLQDGANDLGTATYSVVLGGNSSCAQARFKTATAFSRDANGNVVAVVTLTNFGTFTAADVMLVSATLNNVGGQPLPQSYGNLAPGQSASRTVTFPGTSGTTGAATCRFSGTFAGGSFTNSRRATLPPPPVQKLGKQRHRIL